MRKTTRSTKIIGSLTKNVLRKTLEREIRFISPPVVTNSDYLFLTYPRSGTFLLAHMMRVCGGGAVHLHYLPEKGKKFVKADERVYNKKLILLIRDYKECMTRNVYSWQRAYKNANSVTNDKIDLIFSAGVDINRGGNYVRNIQLFDSWKHDKYLLYYEDLIKNKWAFVGLARWMGLSVESLDWQIEFKKSLKNHTELTLSGGKVKYHERFLKDPEYFDKKMKYESGDLFNKYLKRYELNTSSGIARSLE